MFALGPKALAAAGLLLRSASRILELSVMSLKSHAVEQRRATFLVELRFGAGDLLDLEAVTAIVEHDRIGDCLPALKIAFRQ